MTARNPSLRAVEPGETAGIKPPKTIEEAAERDDELGQLRLTRRAIARKLDEPNCPARDMAALSKRLMEISKEIAAILAREHEEAGQNAEVSDGSFDAAAI